MVNFVSVLQHTDAKTITLVLVVSIVCGIVLYVAYKYDKLAIKLLGLIKENFPDKWLELQQKGYVEILSNGVGAPMVGNVFKQFKVLRYIAETLKDDSRVVFAVESMSTLLKNTLYVLFGGLLVSIIISALLIK